MSTSSSITVHSVKLLKGTDDKPYKVKIDYTEIFPDNSSASMPREFNRTPHKDFQDKFLGLRVHLALLNDLINPKQVKDEELVEKFRVKSVSFKEGKSEGFTMSGQRKGPRGLMGVNSPFFHMEGESMEQYALNSDLDRLLTELRDEAAEYVRGKHAPDAQSELPFEATTIQVEKPIIFPGEETDVSHLYGIETEKVLAEVAKPKSKKKVKQTAETPSGEVEE